MRRQIFTVLSNFHNPETHTVGIWFNTKVVVGTLQPGDDIDKVDFFEMEAIPPLAFSTDEEVIRLLKEKADKSYTSKDVNSNE